MSEEVELKKVRDQLDKLDDKMLEILNDRMELVKKVGDIKHKSGGAIYRPERERQIIARLINNNHGILNQNAIEAIFLEIFAISRNLERPENVAFLGPEGSFTHQVAESKFGAMSSYLPIHSIKGVFREVSNGKAKFGVIPIENSSNGIVSDTVTCLKEYDLKIISEVILPIHHCLATNNDSLRNIKKIYSKDIAFDQCSKFLEDFDLFGTELIPVESTAKAAKLASTEPNSAAICSSVGAKMYNLPILFENIEDSKDNKTRFFIVSDFENSSSGNDKTTILAKLPNKPGALVDFLTDFDKAKINLTKIKSHIIEGLSLLFIDFDGHKNDANVQEIFKKHSEIIKFLGSYIKEADDI